MDIKANAAIQKGMPYKGYHGRTGVVFNVSKRALTVTVNKLVSAMLQLHAWMIKFAHAVYSGHHADTSHVIEAAYIPILSWLDMLPPMSI